MATPTSPPDMTVSEWRAVFQLKISTMWANGQPAENPPTAQQQQHLKVLLLATQFLLNIADRLYTQTGRYEIRIQREACPNFLQPTKI